jgi:beta-mannanase
MKKFLFSLFLFFFLSSSVFAADTHPFLFGLKIQDNSADIALNIENTYNIHLPVVGFFYDDFSDREFVSLSDAIDKLGIKNRMYHLTVNPLGFTAKELYLDPEAKGFKAKYERLFKLIKEKNIKVLFRFCHEMNGGWYSWASDDIYYPLMWQRVWQWSRDV